MRQRHKKKTCLALIWILLFPCAALRGQSLGSLQGRVTDPSGAVVPGAVVVAAAQLRGSTQRATTNGQGHYEITGLAPGKYSITTNATGFSPSVERNVIIVSGRVRTLVIHLKIALQEEQVEVRSQAAHLQVAPENNASAVVVSGEDLNALSNDPDELQSQLSELAGPSVGPNGGEIYIDGLTGGDLPPKSSIREIRVNSDPFSVENDRLGYGRIDIYTKPGSATFHGTASAQYNDSSMNALSPFLAATGQRRPAYHTWLLNGNVGGPLGKTSSFFFDMDRRNINRANLVNTVVLDPSLNVVPYVATVPNPRVLTNISPRVDFQLSPRNMLSVNYRYFKNSEQNDGVDTQSLPSQAFDRAFRHHNLQLIDNFVVNQNVVNETRFQYLHFHNFQESVDFSPTLDVIGAFEGGGNSIGSFQRYETHYELRNTTRMNLGRHLVQFGVFLRDILRNENTNGGFNGAFTFNSLSDYQQTEQGLQNGLTLDQIQAAGYGPSQFNITTGNLYADVNRLDGALFAGDNWNISPHFTASYGVRFESQNAVRDHADWAPRVGIAWGLGHGRNTKTVLRAGWGIFYQRFDDDQMIISARLNGRNQRTYIVNSPLFFPDVPPLAAISAGNTSLPTIYQIGPQLQSPYDMDMAVSLERQLFRGATASITYVNSRGIHQSLTNNVNAPLPGTFNPAEPASGVRPFGNEAGNIYQYVSPGIYRQNQLIANVRAQAADKLSLFGYYVYNDAYSDTAGVDSFATNPWNISQDYGRARFGIRHRGLIGGSYALPLDIRVSSMMMVNSGLPFSITLGKDLYGTGIHNARPAFATAATPAADLVVTPYGSFNLSPAPGEAPIPPNTEVGPANFMLNFRLSRTFGFGGEGSRSHGGGDAVAQSGDRRRHRGGLGGRGLSGGGGSELGGATRRRYALTLSLSVLNAFNNVNLAPPISVLGSPLFGQSIALAGGPFSAQIGNPVANRLINVNVAFSF